MKKLITAGRKYSLHISNQGLIPRIFEVFLQISKGEKKTSIEKWEKLKWIPLERGYPNRKQTNNQKKQIEKGAKKYVIMTMQINTIMKCHCMCV